MNQTDVLSREEVDTLLTDTGTVAARDGDPLAGQDIGLVHVTAPGRW